MDYRHYWHLSRGVSYESLETRDGIGHFDKSENSGNLKNNAQLTHICSDMCRVGQLGTFILTVVILTLISSLWTYPLWLSAMCLRVPGRILQDRNSLVFVSLVSPIMFLLCGCCRFPHTVCTGIYNHHTTTIHPGTLASLPWCLLVAHLLNQRMCGSEVEVLEAQYAISKDIGPKEKRCISSWSSLVSSFDIFNQYHCQSSIIRSPHSAHCRHVLYLTWSGWRTWPPPWYNNCWQMSLMSLHLSRTFRVASDYWLSVSDTIQGRAMFRAYNELIKVIPLVKSLDEHGDVEALAALYSNVCSFTHQLILILSEGFKLRKGQTRLGAMMREISNLLLWHGLTIYMVYRHRHLELIRRQSGVLRTTIPDGHMPAEFDWDDTKWEYSIDYNLFQAHFIHTQCLCQHPWRSHRLYSNCPVMAQILLRWFKLQHWRREQGLFRSTLLVKVCSILRVHNSTRSVSIYHRLQVYFHFTLINYEDDINGATNPPRWNAPKRTRRPRVPMLLISRYALCLSTIDSIYRCSGARISGFSGKPHLAFFFF